MQANVLEAMTGVARIAVRDFISSLKRDVVLPRIRVNQINGARHEVKTLVVRDEKHPRDLYNVNLLYENEGLTDDLFRTFLIHVASSRRLAHELFNPNLIDLYQPYAREFEGMTKTAISRDELLDNRKRMIADIQSHFDDNTKRFLLGLHYGKSDFKAINRLGAANLPAGRLKLINLEKLKKDNPEKHAEQRGALETLF